jgi:hypothetical protein
VNTAPHRRSPRRQEPAEGETWFARLRNAEQLVTVHIEEFTQCTVVLRLVPDSNVSYEGRLGRYLRRDVKFVERVP